MHQSRPSSRPQRAQRLCKVTILVPEYCAEGIRQFAHELRAQHQAEPAPTRFEWRALSPSAELMVSPERSVRCAVRDTRAPGPDRFCWTVAILGQLDPVAKGRAKSRAEARLLAEAALAAYFADWDEPELVQMQIPSTLDGELPSRAFGERDREAPIQIGARYIVKDREGRDVTGELLSGVVHENQMSVVGVLRLDDGNHIMTKMPITEGELNAYRDSPETFFGAYEPSTKAETPVEVYERMLSVYGQTPRERLLEFLSGHPNFEAFCQLSELELAKIYAEGIARNIVMATKPGPKNCT
jgi:hypothetical protein